MPNPMKNKDNGPEGKSAKAKTKAATSAKGRHNQPKGKYRKDNVTKQAKKKKNLTNSNCEF